MIDEHEEIRKYNRDNDQRITELEKKFEDGEFTDEGQEILGRIEKLEKLDKECTHVHHTWQKEYSELKNSYVEIEAYTDANKIHIAELKESRDILLRHKESSIEMWNLMNDKVEELKKTIINNNISFDKEIKELKTELLETQKVWDGNIETFLQDQICITTAGGLRDEAIDELKEQIEHNQKCIFDWLVKTSENREVLRELFEEFAMNYDSGNWTKWRDFFMKLREKLGGNASSASHTDCVLCLYFMTDDCKAFEDIEKECFKIRPPEHDGYWNKRRTKESQPPRTYYRGCKRSDIEKCWDRACETCHTQAFIEENPSEQDGHYVVVDDKGKEVAEPFKPRFEVRRGKFGLYFYDNELRKDLDLHEVIIKLRKLQIYEEGTHDHFSTSEKILVAKEDLEFLFNWNPEFMSLDEIKRYNQLKEKYLPSEEDHD